MSTQSDDGGQPLPQKPARSSRKLSIAIRPGVRKITASSKPPLELRLTQLIENLLEPMVISLLAGLVDPLRCVQNMNEALGLGMNLLTTARGLRQGFHQQMSEAFKREQEKQRKKFADIQEGEDSEWLYCEAALLDDSFRQYLKKAGAPKKVWDRSFEAHRLAIIRHRLGGQCYVGNTPDGSSPIRFAIRPGVADAYLEEERKAATLAVTRSRKKKEQREKTTAKVTQKVSRKIKPKIRI